MKISGDKPHIIEAYLRKTRQEEKIDRAKKAEKHSVKVDKVEISKEARDKEISKIKALLEKVPEIRKEKVAALKKAIEDGNYEVKGKEVAKKMIKEGIDEFV